MHRLPSASKYPDLSFRAVYTSRRNYATYLCCSCFVGFFPWRTWLPIHAVCQTVLDNIRRPSDATHEPIVYPFERLYAFPLLTKVPTPERSVVCDRNEILAAWVEDQPSHPIVMTSQDLDAVSPPVPEPDLLVSRTGGHELCRARRRWRFFLPCKFR